MALIQNNTYKHKTKDKQYLFWPNIFFAFYNRGQNKKTAWHVAHSHLFEQIIWHINGCKKRKEKRASKTIHSDKKYPPLQKIVCFTKANITQKNKKNA